MPTSNATKIELVTEAIEALVLAVVVATSSHDTRASAAHHQNVVDAREVVSSSLKELLTPTLRVVQSVDERAVGAVKRTITKTEAFGTLPTPNLA